MSRWAETFAALSGGSDTPDTMRHSAEPPAKMSQSVHSVTVPPAAEAPSPAAGETPAIWSEAEEERAAIVEHDGGRARLSEGRRTQARRGPLETGGDSAGGFPWWRAVGAIPTGSP